jgi:hydrogenase maturation protease
VSAAAAPRRDRLHEAGRRLFIGIGNPLRGDDVAGLLAARALRARGLDGVEVRELEGEPVDLIESWQGAAQVLLADAVTAGGEAGRVHRVEVGEQPLPAVLAGASTHTLGLAEALELARALERLPPRLVVYGIEGTCFQTGAEPGPAVLAAVELVATAAAAELLGGD